MLIALLTASLVVNSGLFSTERLIPEGETTPTTTASPPTYTTSPTTTTPPEEVSTYHIMFSFVWGPDIAEGDKCWVEFAAYEYHEVNAEGKRDQVTLGAGHGDTGDWFYGSWGEVFTEGESVTIAMESYDTWYDLLEWPDVTVGPWSHVFTFYSYKYGFSSFLTSELRVSWELI